MNIRFFFLVDSMNLSSFFGTTPFDYVNFMFHWAQVGK